MKDLKVAEQVALVRLMGEFLGQVPGDRRDNVVVLVGGGVPKWGTLWPYSARVAQIKGMIFMLFLVILG